MQDIKTINEQVEGIYLKWLINKNLVETESLDDGLFLEHHISEGIALNEDDRKEDQRVLLEVEKKGELKRAQERLNTEIFDTQAKKLINIRMYAQVKEKVKDHQYVMTSLLRLPPGFADIINILHSPSVKFTDIAMMLSHTSNMDKLIINLVNDKAFCKSIGREPRKIKDIQAAVGFLGLTGIRFVLPLLMMKDRIRYKCDYFPKLGQKIWSSVVTVGNTARELLYMADQDRGNQEELQGIVMGIVPFFGYMALHQQFLLTFDDVKQELLTDLRENITAQSRPLYNAIIAAEPDPLLLQRLFKDLAIETAMGAANQMAWDKLGRAKRALDEWSAKKPLEERSIHGQVLMQSIRFSRFELLRRAKRFAKKEYIRPYLQSSRISQELAKELIRQDLRKLNLRFYVN